MKYSILIIGLLVLTSSSLRAQDELITTIGNKACECIEVSRAVNPDSCITNAYSTIIAKSNSMRKIRKMSEDGTLESIIKSSQNHVKENCETFRETVRQSVINSGFQRSTNPLSNQHYIEGTTKMQLGDFKNAIIEFRKAVKYDSSFVEAFDHLGYSHRNINENDSAIYYYNKSLEIRPDGQVALVNIGLAYSQLDEHSKSLDFYNELIQLDSNNVEGYFGKARELMYLNKINESADNAFRAYKMYETMNSGYIEDAVNLISILYERFKEANRTDEILELADKWNINLHTE
jgi:tetratricopeptide (TPR) repeat protein